MKKYFFISLQPSVIKDMETILNKQADGDPAMVIKQQSPLELEQEGL